MSITSKRFYAYLLDTFLVYTFLTLLVNVRFINPYYEEYNESYIKYSEVIKKYYNKDISFEEMKEQNLDNYYNINKYSISNNIEVVVILFLYFVLFQKYNNGQTLGKKIMKIKVVSLNNNKISIWRYLLRLLPMYYVFIGNVLLIIANSISVLTLNSDTFSNVSNIITYLFLGLGILDIFLNIHNKISNTKVELVEEKK